MAIDHNEGWLVFMASFEKLREGENPRKMQVRIPVTIKCSLVAAKRVVRNKDPRFSVYLGLT